MVQIPDKWRCVAILTPVRVLVPLLVAVTLLQATPAWADGTPAGTVIENTAQVDFDVGGSNISLSSNVVSITVDERIDVVVIPQSPQVFVNAGDVDRGLLFTISNTGNGNEVFQFAIDSNLAGDDYDPVPSVPAIYFDTDSSGDFNAGDVAYTPGINDPLLAADASINILLVNGIPAGVVNGNIGRSQLTATSVTGSGVAGDQFANQGDGGVDAVIGTTGGTAADTGEYVVGSVVMSIIKSVVIADPFGGVEPVPGATLTYTVTVEVTNNGTAVSSVFRDPIPANTSYVASSIFLNGAGLTDATDGDLGEFDVSGAPNVVVRLGNLVQAAGVQTVSFQVTID